ncbi:MAG TPA: bacillithiol system redox-active protein YtxJ [Saprospiraceae bacterium]|nr:bacillithiol system redox-active protein YtxJ [Saprospiraceae bacterium]
MIPWRVLEDVAEIETITKNSFDRPCLIFKHSRRCEISHLAKKRLEREWNFDKAAITPYFLDLIPNREISDEIARHFAIRHESPQILLIAGGICTYTESHVGISFRELEKKLG